MDSCNYTKLFLFNLINASTIYATLHHESNMGSLHANPCSLSNEVTEHFFNP